MAEEKPLKVEIVHECKFDNYSVVRIIKNANCTYSLLGANDVLLANFSQIKQIYRTDPQRGGQLIVFEDNDCFKIATDVWMLEDLNGRTYARLDPKSGDINTQYQNRLNEIFTILCEQIQKGCDDCCSEGADGCSFNYQYSLDAFSISAGQFSYNASGILIISPYTYDSQDLTGTLDTLTTGSRITFTSPTTKSEFVVFELTGDAGLYSGLVIATANIISGSVVGLTEDGVFCTSIDKSTAGSGGSQTWQQTLDTGSALDKNNSIAGGGFNFEMLDNSSVYLETLAGTANGNLYLDPTTAALETTDSGTGQSSSAYSQIGGANAEAGLVAGDGADSNRFLVKDNEVTIGSTLAGFEGIKEAADFSPNYVAASLVRKSYVDGLIGSGVQGVTGDSVDNTDPQNPVVNAIPYDKATQTTDITGGPYDVDPASTSGFTSTNGTVTATLETTPTAISETVTSATSEGVIGITSTQGRISLQDLATSDTAATGAQRNVGGDVNGFISASGVSGDTAVEAYTDKIRVITPFVFGGGDPTGMVLTGQNVDGDIEYETPTGGSNDYVVVSTDQSLVVNQNIIAAGGASLNLTLPTTAAVGTTIKICGDGTANGWVILQNASQRIVVGTLMTTAGVAGSVASQDNADGIELVCTTADLTWTTQTTIGNLTVT